MGARSFDDEIAQVPSRDCAYRYFAPNNEIGMMIQTTCTYCTHKIRGIGLGGSMHSPSALVLP